jgi:hypothetical protein
LPTPRLAQIDLRYLDVSAQIVLSFALFPDDKAFQAVRSLRLLSSL